MAAIVAVSNEGDKTITLGWNGEKWVIKPGGQEFVPMEAAVLAFGDPYLADTAETPSRSEEWNRIRVRYGIYADLHKCEDNWTEGNTDDPKARKFKSLLPKVKVFTSQGEELPMLMHDPEGTIAAAKLAGEPTADSTSDLIMRRLDAIESENRALRDELARRQMEQAQATPSMGVDAGPILPVADTADTEPPTDLGPEDLDEFDGMSIEEMTAILNARAEQVAADAADDEPGDATPTDNPPSDDAPVRPGRGKKL